MCIMTAIFFMYLLGAFELKNINDSVCPGDILTFECTVFGGVSTVYKFKSSAFDSIMCNIEDIVLIHSRFNSSASSGDSQSRSCTIGNRNVALHGQSVRNVNGSYTSQLKITLFSSLYGSTIDCVHDNGSKEISVGSYPLGNLSASCMFPTTKINTGIIASHKLVYNFYIIMSDHSQN